jgi:hypothetical protein
MKRVLWMVLLTLALPVAAFAGDVDFQSQTGTLTGNSTLMTLSGTQTVNAISGLGAPLSCGACDLASISFTTGALTQVSGSTTEWTFASGGSFTITADTSLPGIASGATIFSGQFSCGHFTWTLALQSNGNGTNVYMLAGVISGTWYNGKTVNGVTINTVLNSGLGLFDGGVGTISSGDTTIVTTPEPGSLMLMGTGLVGLGGVLRRKLKA